MRPRIAGLLEYLGAHCRPSAPCVDLVLRRAITARQFISAIPGLSSHMFWRLVWTVIPVAAITALIAAVLSSNLSSAATGTGGAASGPECPATTGAPLVVTAHPVAASPTPTAASAAASCRNVHMLEITRDGPRAGITRRQAGALEPFEQRQGIALVVHVDRCGWTPAASAGWLSLVSFACIQFLHVRPRRRSPYWPHEHAGATGFLLNETSPFSPTAPSCWHARLPSRTCHTQALTTDAIGTPPLSPRHTRHGYSQCGNRFRRSVRLSEQSCLSRSRRS